MCYYYETNYLSHHGIKGQHWGIRRYQNKDGSLTLAGKKRALKMQDKYTKLMDSGKYRDHNGNMTYAGRKKALKMKEKYSELTGGKTLRKYPFMKKAATESSKSTEDADKNSTNKNQNGQKNQQQNGQKPNNQQNQQNQQISAKEMAKRQAAKREKLLNTSDPRVLYDNRRELTTEEIKERINRINTEQQLNDLIPKDAVKKGSTFVDKLNKAASFFDAAGKTIQNVDKAYTSFANSAMGKELGKKLGIQPPTRAKQFDINKAYKNMDYHTDKEIENYAKRIGNYNTIEKYYNKKHNGKNK